MGSTDHWRCGSVDPGIRTIFHWTAPWVRAHVLLCVLAYDVELHIQGRPAPLQFDHDSGAAAQRTSIV